MTSQEQEESTHEPPGQIPDGSDTLTARMCATHGLYKELKDTGFYPTANAGVAGPAHDPWRDVELRVVWCDHSVWGIAWVVKGMASELEEAKRTGVDVRRVSLVRLRGGNHFVSTIRNVRSLAANSLFILAGALGFSGESTAQLPRRRRRGLTCTTTVHADTDLCYSISPFPMSLDAQIMVLYH